MVDYQRIVDEIRSFLQSNDQVFTDSLKALAVEYGQACQEVNQRLRRCADFLHQGLRSEAIQLAQAEPVLLEQVAVLDFPEKAQWEDLSITYNLPPAPKLNLEAAEALNEAYAAILPLENLLRKHRRLALARAPLMLRLATMREIAYVDPTNSIWEDDIREFEKVRFGQLEVEARQAVDRNEPAAMETIRDELTTTMWVSDPPPRLAKYVDAAVERNRQKQIRQLLEDLQHGLNDAFAALDLNQGRKLRMQWQEAIKNATLPREDALLDKAAPALQWLSKEDRHEASERKYQAAVAQFERVLMEPISREELEQQYQVLRNQGYELPSELEMGYRRQVQNFEKAARRRRARFVGIALAIVALLAILIGFWIDQANQAKKAGEAAIKIGNLLDSHQIAEARTLLDELSEKSPRTARRPELAEVRQRVDTDEAVEKQRVALFEETLRRAEAEPIDPPDTSLLEKAEKLARHPDEKARVQRLRDSRREQAWRVQRQRDEEFLPRFRDLQNKVERLETLVQDDFESKDVSSFTNELRGQIDRMIEEFKGVSEEKRKWGPELAARFQRTQESVDRHKLEASLLNDMTLALHRRQNVADYAAATKAYLKSFADTARGKDFLQALKEQPLWEEATEWQRLIEPFANKPFDVKPDQALALTEQCQAFLGKHAQYVDIKTVRDYLYCVEAVSQQHEATKGTAAAKLRELFTSLVVKNLWVLNLTNDRAYYVKADPEAQIEKAKKSATYFNVSYLVNFEGKERGLLVKLEDLESFGRAPQSVIADSVREIPANFADKTWEQATVNLAKKIRSRKDMDPVLQFSLLKRVIEYASRGSYPLGLALEEHQRRIKQTSLDLTVLWIDPRNEEAKPVREQARELIKQLPSLEEVPKAANSHRQKVEDAVRQSHRVPVAWLVRERRKWTARLAFQLSGAHELCVVVPDKTKGVTWKSIGTLSEGRPMIETLDLDAHLEGRLVFARRTDKQ
jgi:hypothetical protein